MIRVGSLDVTGVMGHSKNDELTAEINNGNVGLFVDGRPSLLRVPGSPTAKIQITATKK